MVHGDGKSNTYEDPDGEDGERVLVPPLSDHATVADTVLQLAIHDKLHRETKH